MLCELDFKMCKKQKSKNLYAAFDYQSVSLPIFNRPLKNIIRCWYDNRVNAGVHALDITSRATNDIRIPAVAT
jgi:hypothetical protein